MTKKSTTPTQFTPAQVECLCALLGWGNVGLSLKVIGDTVNFEMGNHKQNLKDINVDYVYRIFPAETDDMADGFKSECYFFKKDLLVKNAVSKCSKYWPDVVLPVLKYVK